jgi:hypothetical protein
MNKKADLIGAAVLLLFAVITFFMSGSVLFDLFGIREREGNYVPFVVWANFFASLLYFCAVYGLATKQRWTTLVLGTSLIILVVTFLTFLYHIRGGGLYETKTIGALIFRIGVTGLFTFIAWKINHPKPRFTS